MTSTLLQRQAATQATLDRYRKKKFDWKKRATCVHLVRFHLRKMGYKPPTVPEMRSLLAAKKALKVRGWENVGDMMDSLLPEIPPASMMLGDIAMLQDADGIGALVIDVGGKVMGWHDDESGLVVMDALKIEKAWRV